MKPANQNAPLQGIRGLTQSQANLLEASGVRSTDQLAKNHPEKLWRWMAEVNSETRIVRRLPSLESVKAWVFQAKSWQLV